MQLGIDNGDINIVDHVHRLITGCTILQADLAEQVMLDSEVIAVDLCLHLVEGSGVNQMYFGSEAEEARQLVQDVLKILLEGLKLIVFELNLFEEFRPLLTGDRLGIGAGSSNDCLIQTLELILQPLGDLGFTCDVVCHKHHSFQNIDEGNSWSTRLIAHKYGYTNNCILT